MTVAQIVNSVGLVLDIAGALMLWKYGLPEALSRKGTIYLVAQQVDSAEKAKATMYDRRSKLGLALLIAGFAGQLTSNFIAK